jgi:hypothetical protein
MAYFGLLARLTRSESANAEQKDDNDSIAKISSLRKINETRRLPIHSSAYTIWGIHKRTLRSKILR